MTPRKNFCPQCGAPTQGDPRFCASCGFDYGKAAEASDATQAAPAAAASAPPASADAGKAAEEKKNQRIGCVGLAVIAFVILVVIGALGSDDDPETAGATTSPTPEETSPEEAPPDDATPPEAPTADPTVADEPTPIPSPIESLDDEPAFADIVLTGTGNSVPRFDTPEDSVAIAEISHTGARNFVVWTIDESGSQTDLLVNVIGNYTGTVLFDELAGSHTDALEVEADGSWTITIKPVSEAFRWDGTETLTGNGDDVVVLDPPSSGLKSTTLTHEGDGNFAIWAYGDFTDLLVNEVGSFSGEVLLADGTFLLEITANGPWTISPPQ